MKFIRIIIADCAVSLVPKEWKQQKKIKQYFEKYHRLPVIDSSVHQHLEQSIPLENRKDRPDILHFGLLTVLGYTNLLDNMELSFSVSDRFFDVDPETRIPRSQKRFYGILEQLLSNSYRGKFIQEISHPNISPNNAVVFSSKGEALSKGDLDKENFIFGGFAHGNLTSTKYSQLKQVKLAGHSLELWTALSRFMNLYHDFHEY